MPDLASLQKTLDISFRDPSLLEQALVHSSYINENPGGSPGSNERLEFLGDAVLGLIVAEKLYRDYPELPEGEMTKLRSTLVCRDTLTNMAESIKLGDFLYLGKGEEASGGRRKPVNLAGSLEAVIAAIFLDQGLEKTRVFILKLISSEMESVTQRMSVIDYKSLLQEFIQSRRQLTPTYRLVESTGPDHDRKFTVEVLAGHSMLGTGTGKSKKLAEMEAARSALKRIEGGFTQ